MAYTTIDNSELHFQTKLYTGNAGTNAITLDGSENMQPDWLWLKKRNSTGHHFSFDSVRGADKRLLISDASTAESSPANYVSSFDTDGFTLGSDSDVNGNSDTFVGWNWRAPTSFSNDASATGVGTIDSSGKTGSGLAIISYTGTGSSGTVAHGLGTTPSMVWIFNRTDGGNGHIFHKALGSTQYLLHASTLAVQTYSPVGIGSLTSTTFSVGTVSGVNGSGKSYIAYVFADVQGYSKIGSYVGNGSTDGPMIYLGFKPAFIYRKKYSGADSHFVVDNKRLGRNPDQAYLFPNVTQAESDIERIDFVSNGFKLRTTDGGDNGSGGTYIYYATAESPFANSNGVPNNAR